MLEAAKEALEHAQMEQMAGSLDVASIAGQEALERIQLLSRRVANLEGAGIVAAADEIGISVPLVVRLEGTNVDEGKAILAKSGFDIISADDLGDAAEKIVSAIGEAS